MAKGYSTEVWRIVYDDSEGVGIEVGPDPDTGALVQLRAKDAKSKEYWGPIDFGLEPAMAKQLGCALIAAADDIERESKKEK